ncbi:MAG: hypothetical protein BWY76_00805 [bacterium ADurb.Bin429]|nr:MAG: hypothetical protein BWY76_00805 [bacterium ADurb.Bin429]
MLTLDNELAQLVTDLKWEDTSVCFTILVVADDPHVVLSAEVLEADEVDLLPHLEGVRIDYWSIADLFLELLCGVASNFSMTRPTGNHIYILSMLTAIRRHLRTLDASQ